MSKKITTFFLSFALSLASAGFSRPVEAAAPAARSVPLASVRSFTGKLPPLNLPQGVILDEFPGAPEFSEKTTVSIENFQFPQTAPSPTGSPFEGGAAVLQVDPRSAEDVEQVLRARVDADAAYGIASSELKTVHIKSVEGQGSQADTVYALFHQVRDGVQVHGAYLEFTIKVIQGRPEIVATMANLYSQVTVNTSAAFSDQDLKDRAQQRLGLPTAVTGDLDFIGRKIIYSDGAWHAANIYSVSNLPIMIAVDVATGQAFAWDGRHGMAEEEGVRNGKVSGRGETSDTRPKGEPNLTEQPLPHLNVSFDGGAVAVTDAAGRFQGKGPKGKPIGFKAELKGRNAVIHDEAGRPLKVSATLDPGKETVVVFNPAGADEKTRSQVTAYISVNHVKDWLNEHGIVDKRIDMVLPVNVNINQDCNAYYTEGRPSLNFFKSSKNCSDTARPGVIYHEYGHFVDDMIGGIMNSGLSEGWGDILSMFILESPLIGDGFLKNPGPDGNTFIRTGENKYQYDDGDEEHDMGQAWMGSMWKFRVALKAAFGEAAGAALATTLVIPTFYAKAATIPAALSQVLINAMDKDGHIDPVVEAALRDSTQAHGIPLPKNPAEQAGLVGGPRGGAGGQDSLTAKPASPEGSNAPLPQRKKTLKEKLSAFFKRIFSGG